MRFFDERRKESGSQWCGLELASHKAHASHTYSSNVSALDFEGLMVAPTRSRFLRLFQRVQVRSTLPFSLSLVDALPKFDFFVKEALKVIFNQPLTNKLL